MLRPVTVTVRVPLDQLAVAPPGLAVTVYPVIGDPPSEDGGAQVTVAWALPAVAETLVGAPGTVIGVTAADNSDAGLVPRAFIAVTVKV